MNRRLNEPQHQFGNFGEVKNILPLPEIEPQVNCQLMFNI
jgi:hypothetical protein